MAVGKPDSRVVALGLSIILAISGVVLGVGGAKLVLLGGSWYYLATGLAFVAAGVLLWHGNAWSYWLYAAMLAWTLIWSLLQVGLDFWALLGRLSFPFLLGLGFWLPPVVKSIARGPRSDRMARLLTVVFFVALAGLVITGVLREDPAHVGPDEAVPALMAGHGMQEGDGEWPGDSQGTRYSGLAQIRPENVSRLAVAWTWRGGDIDRAQGRPVDIAPLKVGDTLYVCTGALIAIDAATGQERWRHRDEQRGATPSCRGLAYYRVPAMPAGALCASRLFLTTGDARLIAIDAPSGRPCRDFAGRGQLALQLSAPMPGQDYLTSAPRIVRGLVVVAGWMRKGQTDSGGALRAYDALTGERVWTFTPGTKDDQPSVFGLSQAGAPLSVDDELGLLYLPTGNAMPDYYGSGAQRYSSAIVALDAETGRERWVFQMTRHDVWDGDVAAQPTLLDLKQHGQRLPVLVQATRRGQVFLLDRRDGTPLGLDVSASGALTNERVRNEEDMWGLTPFDQLWCRLRLRAASAAPDTRSFLALPGSLASADWGGVAADPERHVLVINWTPGARPPADGQPLISPLGMSCNAPLHSYLTAIDLDARRILWNTRLGTVYDRPLAMLRAPLAPAGSLVTRAGLVFIASGQEQLLRAVDLRSGDVIWQDQLPPGSQATPMSYRNAAGRQFVLVASATGSASTEQRGAALVAYTLEK